MTVADPPPLDWDKIEAGYIPSPDQVRDFLAQFDAKLDEAKVKTATLSARFPATRDERGRSIQDDWRDYVLTESSLAKIAAERRVIAEAIDGYRWFDATAALRRLRVHMLRELRTMQAITQYWQQLGDHAPRFEPYRAMLKENSLTPHYEQNLSSLERTFQLQIEHGLFDVAMNYTIPRMWALRARAARLDGNALERLGDLPDEKRLYPMAANSSCLPEASASSGSASVKLDPNRSVPSLEYPVAARALWEEGSVYVGMWVGEAGCAMKASVYGSSGYEQLDRAAVEHVLRMRFLPAERDGRRSAGVGVTPVNFKLGPANNP